MGRTIVQEYGPIYGEPVNGTVSGRPNGSVYVPITNTIVGTLIEDYRYLKYITINGTKYVQLCSSSKVSPATPEQNYNISALSQDLASSIHVQIFSDEELSTGVALASYPAGQFNRSMSILAPYTESLEDEQPLYLRAVLINNGSPIAISEVIPITMVV